MKKKCFVIASVCLVATMVFTACTQKYPGYKKTKDGLYYKFYSQNPTAQQPRKTDFMKLAIACYLNDSMYYDFQKTESEVYSQLTDAHFPADLQEAYSMMHVGDSASFYIKADSVALKYYDQDPAAVGLKADDYFRYEIKLLEVKSQDDFQRDVEEKKNNMMERSRQNLLDYVEANFKDATLYPSGVYIVSTEAGKGRCPVKGEKVEVDFSASLLNGQFVGSTFDSPDKFSFVLGEGYTIQGWEEIVPKMHLGERVTAVIPFELAYGDHAVGSIPPYANLIYDIKLLKITTVAELQAEAEQAMKALKAESEKAFADFLKSNDITDHTASGLYYAKELMTDGAMPQKGQTARIKFEASYLDGTKLGSTEDLGDLYDVAYGEGKVLRGLEEGIGMMHVGEKVRFVLPYYLAYGENPYGNIPAYTNIVFDVELVEIK